MSERSHSILPPNATSISNGKTTPSAVLDKPFESEEQDYTIKCICIYPDDDGNTVACDQCDTWQHLICYYPDNEEEARHEDFKHFCHECAPRPLNRQEANRRQKQQRQANLLDDGDRKPKRTQAKPSHKKKARPTETVKNAPDHEAINGHRQPTIQDGTHTKKAKPHKSQQSINSKHSPSQSHPHPLSPAVTPQDLPDDFHLFDFTPHLRELYESDSDGKDIDANVFATVSVADAMSDWVQNDDNLRETIKQDDIEGIFQKVKPDLTASNDFKLDDLLPWPDKKVRSERLSVDDKSFEIKYLGVRDTLGKDRPIGELTGHVGFQEDICKEEAELFSRIGHPPPFVFFHPHLPLYIDTRREGSICRYTRRSCQANSAMETYIINQSEYHFCLVSERNISPEEQITLPWDFRLRKEVEKRWLSLLGLGDSGPAALDTTEAEYEELGSFIRSVLSEFGGCACGLGKGCSFYQFHLQYRNRIQASVNGHKSAKARKPKSQLSPASDGIGHLEGSEFRMHPNEDALDTRSNTGSLSKPGSRDRTPSGPLPDSLNDTFNSERERRKLAKIEMQFQQREVEDVRKAEAPRKKKRVSDAPSIEAASQPAHKKQKSNARPPLPHHASKSSNGGTKYYKNASVSRHHSNSPSVQTSPTQGSPQSRKASLPNIQTSVRRRSVAPTHYCDSSTQTCNDLDSDAWYRTHQATGPPKRVIPLARRLFTARKKALQERAQRRALIQYSLLAGQEVVLNDPVSASPILAKSLLPGDKMMVQTEAIHDAPTQVGSSTTSSAFIAPESRRTSDLKVELPAVHLPSMYAHGTPATPSSIIGTPASTPITALGGISAHSPSAFSPIIGNVAPSPVKKKLSLSDYKAARAKRADPPGKTPLAIGSSASDVGLVNPHATTKMGPTPVIAPVEKASTQTKTSSDLRVESLAQSTSSVPPRGAD
jgi:hypothetical protein